ncbi:hypothetical protein GPECTOR_79g123 [Gonium pectorale]|uniref:Elongator complex protein 1 n=1 Tax=Gonium pectorale TaxID=33097 RepID=A0A150G1Z9_GONPE|nr:hypothetical protein GPECTOR_79g123 [Gonium pectorale]|eukprot:KXZ43844.1 hypothetical protein GPECTOR_79g123 [Gonium pectorale]
MKNLIIERDVCTQLALRDDSVAGFCLNSAESRLYVITDGGDVHCYSLGEANTPLWTCALGPELLAGADGPDGGADGAWTDSPWLVSCSHVLELDAVCLATRGGGIALLHVGEDAAQRLEQVGNVDDGLAALEWSPDGELLAALSGSGNLLVMNQAWELIYEGPAAGPAAAAATPADAPLPFSRGRVSWRGDGKYFAVVCAEPQTATAAANSTQAAAPPAAYRVRIWDRTTMELHATGDAAEGLLPVPAWQPNGRHLYVAAVAAPPLAGAPAWAGASPPPVPSGEASTSGAAPACPAVLLYERNGLRHGGFTLPNAAPLHSLAWSCDSELLSVLSAPGPAESTGAARPDGCCRDWVLQVWHRSNWHWYLKHERRYPPLPGAAAAAGGPHVRWDEQAGGLLHVLTPGGLYEQVSLAWDVCVSARGTAAVVDGSAVLLTPLRHGLVPPPMCAARVALPEAAVDVAIAALPAAAAGGGAGGPDGAEPEEDEVLAALTSGGRLLLARSVEEDLWQETLEDQQALAADVGAAAAALLPAAPDLGMPLAGGRRARALCWLAGVSSLLVLASPYPEAGLEDGPGDVLVQVDVEWLSCGPADPFDPRVTPEVRLTEQPPVYAGKRVLRIAPHPAGGAAVELAGGAVARFCTGAAALRPCGPRSTLPAPCTVVRSLPPAALGQLGAAQEGEPAPLLGLSRGGLLAWGSTVISPSDVTSFAVRSYGPGGPALVFTTRKNLLYTVLVSQLLSYTHRELTADPKAFRGHRREGEMQAAMHAAMRPHAATAASRDVAVRAVEAGAVLVACPAGAAAPADADGAPAPAAGACGAAAGVASAPEAAAVGGGAAGSTLRPLSERISTTPVVLQMPRGNLEGVAPRGLVLAALLGALRAGQYGEAWRLAAVQRVDLNLLVDYQWPAFLSATAAFTAAVRRPADLCDLLFALRPGSVLAEGGAYAGALEWLGEPAVPALDGARGQTLVQGSAPVARTQAAAGRQEAASGAGAGGGAGVGAGKVTAVCTAVREAVLALPDAHRYLEVVVSSYARSNPPQLEAAMRCIRDAKERELTGAAAAPCPPSTSSVSSAPAGGGHSSPADKALKHLLLYVDADELYGTALGMYDMPLAYMVVVNAQKDPGEYMAELGRLGAISPPALQRHAVDVSLRRWGSALRNLVEAGPQHFAQALQLARERGLLRQLLQLYENDPERRPVVLDAYGEHLEASKRYDDAAVSYMSAGQLEKALRAYRAAGRWRMVFVLAGQLQYDESAVQALAAELADELAASGAAADAAAVLLTYLNDVDNAVRTYCTAHEWREAVRVSHAQWRPDLVETVVAPAAAGAAAALLAEARESEERLRKYGARLADVRARRLAMAAAVVAADEGAPAAPGPEDMQSDVMSLVSGLSIYTDATAAGVPGAAGSAAGGGSASSRAPSTVGGRRAHKQTKKLQKAATRVRQGSPLEEASLVSHCHSLAPRAATLEEAAQLSELLVLLGHDDDARLLQRAVAAWQAAYQEVRDDIHAHPVPVEGPGHARAEMERLLQPPPDASAVAWKWDVLRDFGSGS